MGKFQLETPKHQLSSCLNLATFLWVFPGLTGMILQACHGSKCSVSAFFFRWRLKLPVLRTVIPRSMKGIPILGTYTQNPYQLRSLLSFSSPQKKNKWEFRPTKVRKNMSTRQKILQYFTNLDLPEIRRYIIYPLLNPPFKAI